MKIFLASLILAMLVVPISITADSSATVSVSFEVKDESGNPLQNTLVIIQGITNTDFSEEKLTDSTGKVSFTLNKNELFVYIVYKQDYKKQTENFSINENKNFQITLKKESDDQWVFYRLNNGEVDFQFNSLDDDINYQPGDYIKEFFEIRNVAGKNIQLLEDKSIFKVVDSKTINPLRAWGNLNPSEHDVVIEIILKADGWIRATLSEDTVKICGGNIIAKYKNLEIELTGDESVCIEEEQKFNKIPEWILRNNYKLKLDYVYKIDGAEKQINFVSQEFFIDNIDWKPEIASVPETDLAIDNEWTYQIQLKDYDESFSKILSMMNYKLIETPSGMTVDKDTGVVKYTPSQNGNYDVTVRVYHEYFEDDSEKITYSDQEFTLNVGGGTENDVPVITSTPVTSVNENMVYSYQVNATDDDNDTLTYSLTQAPSWLSINSDTGLVSGTAPEVSTNADFGITITVSDNTDAVTQIYTLTVINVNKPPTITSTPITSVNEAQTYSYGVEASDADGDTLIYILTTAPNWLSINSETGLISGTAPSVDSNTDYDIVVEVSDGKDSTTQNYTLTVIDIPEPNNAPIAQNQSITTEFETPFEITLSATDEDNDVLTYSIESNPSNGILSDFDSSTGELIYIPNGGFSGSDSFTFTANDGQEDSNTATVSITVNPKPNSPPVITSAPIASVNENTQYIYDVDATDADNDTLTYNLIQSPSWLSINDETGVISGTAPEVAADTNYSVTIEVSDSMDSDTQNYLLSVINVNKAPVITSIPIMSVSEEQQYSYQVIATDDDGDELTYSITGPLWLSIDSSTGLITGTALEVVLDTDFSVTITVSDGEDLGSQNYVLTVININKIPVITSTPITEVNENQNYVYQVIATDDDGDNIIYNLTTMPIWLSINSETGLISGIAPEVSSDIDYNITIEISDGTDNAIQEYILTVRDIAKIKVKDKDNDLKLLPVDGFYENMYLKQLNSEERILTYDTAVQNQAGIISTSRVENIKELMESPVSLLILLNLNLLVIINSVLIIKRK